MSAGVKLELPGEPFRPRPVAPVFPQVPWERNRIWMWDAVRREAPGAVRW